MTVGTFLSNPAVLPMLAKRIKVLPLGDVIMP
jgi:hypothetical protein